MTSFWCPWAWLGDGDPTASVRITTEDERIGSVQVGGPAQPEDVVLDGLTLPGFANSHSHVFHRALRGRTHRDRGDFWSWRTQMYRVAADLDPDGYHQLAVETFSEMVAAGYTVVGEFHYLHHQPDGRPYDDPNVMSLALIDAARKAGIRLTLLDALYLHGGIDDGGSYIELDPVQRRFSDGSGRAWQDRMGQLPVTGSRFRIGAAIHSVRAVDPDSMEPLRAWADATGAPVHAHVSEQPAENRSCQTAHRRTPTRLLADRGLVDDRFTAVHATHVTSDDITDLGDSSVCLCPTTEQDLADGIGPSRLMADGGVNLCIGSDSQAIIDPVAEVRAVEMHQRLFQGKRGVHRPVELAQIGSANGYRALGWSDGGRIAVGALADLVTIDLGDALDANDILASALLHAAPVTTTVVGGSVVSDRR